MAKQTLIIDDLSGDTGAKTRQFSFDGMNYEIDLTDASFATFKGALKPFIKVARATGPGRSRPAAPARARRSGGSRKARGAAKAPTEAAVIRAWARAQGLTVTERGRVAPELRAAWQAAGSPR
jgi:hypothetical protein